MELRNATTVWLVVVADNRFCTWREMDQWLEVSVNGVDSPTYRHRLYVEQAGARDNCKASIRTLLSDAHADAVKHLRRALPNDLDPLALGTRDPAHGYPHLLHIDTLKGYFGEILSGAIAGSFSPWGLNWKVPAFLFRWHLVALQQLDLVREQGGEVGAVPGRTGDDCAAYLRNGDGKIRKALFCEAKCTRNHRTDVIDEVHEQASSNRQRPVDLMRVAEILLDRGDPESVEWANALTELYLLETIPADYERCDMVTYVCGQKPVRNATWISTDTVHPNYTGGRRLEVAEVHIEGVEEFVREMYGSLGNGP